MKLLPFPKYIYKGNSVNSVFEIMDTTNNNENYIFQIGDILRVGIKHNLQDTDYVLYKEFIITEVGTAVAIQFTPEETDILPNVESKGILEIELEYNDGSSINTVYQAEITFKGVVINE
jgi:hypothetical protein